MKGSYPLVVEQIIIIVENLFHESAWTRMDKALCGDPNFRAIRLTISLGGYIGRNRLADKSIVLAMPGLYSEGRVRVRYMADEDAR